MAESPRIEELRRRVESDPASIAFAALAEEYRRAGRFDEAIATCTAGLERHPAYLSAHVTLGRALLEVGQFDAARAELEHVVRLAPENLAAIRGLAEIHHRTGILHDSQDDYGTQQPGPTAGGLIPLSPSRTGDAALPEAWDAPAVQATTDAVSLETDLDSLSSEFAAAPVPVPAAPDPALAGLESFLAAILRARTERDALRS